MDDIVLRGMAKWPGVPAVYGWLALDRRGHWLIKGSRITHPGVIAFIGRNYTHDPHGRWFFQNGPQRVFVALEYAPFVYRLVKHEDSVPAIETHVGTAVMTVSGAWVDENGVVLLETEHGIGTVHDGDLECLLPLFVDINGNRLGETALDEQLERVADGQSVTLWLAYRQHAVKVKPILSRSVAGRFGFSADPARPDGEGECG